MTMTSGSGNHSQPGQFDASLHPRSGDGKFAVKQQAEADLATIDLSDNLPDRYEDDGSLGDGYDPATTGEYAFDDVVECKENWQHNTSVDEDGYCNLCGTHEMYREDCIASGSHLDDLRADGRCESCGEAPDGDDVAAGRWDSSDAHAEAEAAESYAQAARDGDMGAVTLTEGARTPWGKAQHVDDVAPGVAFLGTAGHGGYKLSRERNALIPAPFRNESGWYEEDMEEAIVGYFHPDTLLPPNVDAWTHPEDIEAARETARAEKAQKLKDYLPDEWTKATGENLSADDSRVRGEQMHRTWAELTDSFVTKSAIGDPAPRGSAPEDRTVSVTVEHARTGERRIVTVPENDYHQNRGDYGRFVAPWTVTEADLAGGRYPSRPDAAHDAAQAANAAKMAAPRHHGPDKADYLYATRADGSPSPYTPAQRKAISKDLAQAWRNDDGQVETLADILASRGVATKSVRVENGVRKYSLREPAGDGSAFYDYPVSKATWEAVDAPDGRTEADKLRQEVQYHRAATEKAARAAQTDFRNDAKREAARAAQQRLAEARAALEAHEQQNGL